MRKSLLFVALLGVSAIVWAAQDEPATKDTIRNFMHKKLEHSQKLLEGIAVEDFPSIVRESQQLSLLSREATWKVFETEDYVQHSTEFRRTADAITEAGRKKNLDAAALAYVDMTMKCVNCHKYVRGVRVAAK
jgi:hypothetical protein